MGLKIVWTQFAQDKLRDIFDYYERKTEPKVARKVVSGVVGKTIDLDKHPQKGQREELLKDRPQNFRYLIYKSYKIIYWINEEKKRIEIANIFDCRQNPDKIDETI